MAENTTIIDCNTLIAKTLAHQGVTEIFGVFGSTVNSLEKRFVAEGIRFSVFYDEESAGKAASSHGFLTGKPGLLLTESRPGCVRMVFISGRSDLRDSGKGVFQELDEASVEPLSAYRVPFAILWAVTRPTTDQRGGCYVNLSSDILHQRVFEDTAKALILAADEVFEGEKIKKYIPLQDVRKAVAERVDVEKVVAVLKQAQRPLIVFRRDAEYAKIEDEVRKLVESTGIPFLSIPTGKGLIPDSHDLAVNAARSLAIRQCDVALVIGQSLNWWLHVGEPPKWAKDVKFILVDALKEEIESTKPYLGFYYGDAEKVLGSVNKVIDGDPFCFGRNHLWVESITKKVKYNVSRMEGQSAKDVSRDAMLGLGSPARVLVSEGANTMDVVRPVLPQMEPRTRLDAGTWGTMGAGLCIAAALASPDRLVVAAEGDSGFGCSAMGVEYSMDSHDEGSSYYSKPIVAVIDGCRGMSKPCGVNDLSFLSDDSELVDYKSLMNCCDMCKKEGKVPTYGGIDAHGYFCASIIASRRIDGAFLGEIDLGTLSGNVPPPRIAIYAVGCPCTQIYTEDISNGIREAIIQKANVVSISLMRDPRALEVSRMVLDDLAVSLMDAFRANTLVVLAAGNYGEHGLSSIQISPPWCLTVGSCTPKKKFKSKVEFKSDASVKFDDIEGYSISMFSSSAVGEYLPLRKEGDIKDKPCIMYLNRNEIVIRASPMVYNFPTIAPLVHITKQTSNTVCDYFERAAAQNGSLYALCHSSERIYVPDTPLVSEFSGRGPCSFFNEFMKPDLCAQGEDVSASWPDDVPLEGSEDHASFNVLSGTSFSTPLVAAGLAMVMVKRNLSVSATISAAITTADKMHGKDVAYEFAHGAGEFNLEKAMQVGLVYEETAENFERYCYPLRGVEKFCFELNLPYFSATFPSNSKDWKCKFMRKLKSVEKGRCIYLAEVRFHAATIDVPLQSIECIVAPNKLVFEGENDEQTFELSVYLPNTKSCSSSFGLVSGSVIWVKESEGVDDSKVVVDCPIILSSRA